MFYIPSSVAPRDITLQGLRVRLEDVEPNNVFWLIRQNTPSALTIVGEQNGSGIDPTVATGPSIVPGNFIADPTQNSGLNIGRRLAVSGVSTTPGTPVPSPNPGGAGNSKFDPTVDGKAIYVTFRGARFLGFRSRESSSSGANIGINPSIIAAAMTSVNEPIALPVLQINAPAVRTSAGRNDMPEPSKDDRDRFTRSINGANKTTNCLISECGAQWTMRATPVSNQGKDASIDRTEVNVYSVAGNVGSRSGVPYIPNYGVAFPAGTPANGGGTAEQSGGLPNFVRLLESWTGVPLKIAGGFLQNTRSRYASAPLNPTFPYLDLSLDKFDFSSDAQTLWLNPANNTEATTRGLSKFRKYGNSITGPNIPFYSPPLRLFGFDVGILTQTADLFASRFSTAIPTPDEFYRETDVEDRYVRQLLCALEPQTVDDTTRLGVPPNQYVRPALRGTDLPQDCGSVVSNGGTFPFPPAAGSYN